MQVHEISLKESGKITRLTNKTFNFDTRIKDGFFSANYFLKAQRIVAKHLANNIVTMQFFQRKDNVIVCGLDESIALIHSFANNVKDLRITALNDGDIINANEPVLKITGRYEDFGFLESLIDGILARRSSVATNVRDVVEVLNGKDCFSMADRQDDYLTQMGDGYATYVAGIKKFSTDAQGYWVNVKGMGTMPHALIQLCEGDIVRACSLYAKTIDGNKVSALVDYNNDCVTDALNVARVLKEKLASVRLDTSKALTDKYFEDKDTSYFDARGVNVQLVKAVRNALDSEGYKHVKIVVSSSFNPTKISYFEKEGAPVDTYGVGSYFVNNQTIGFTGDLVSLNGKHKAKVGRKEIDNPRLQAVNFPIY